MSKKQRGDTLYYRNELKYVIHEGDYAVMRNRMADVLPFDKNADSEGGYWIRSLYYDDPYMKALRIKLDGVDEREKYRIRFYNYSSDRVSLERKEKRGPKIHKDSALLTPDELAQIMADDTVSLLYSEKKLLRRFALSLRTQRLRPVQLVDYRRDAFVVKEGNVRITFDRHLRAPLTIKNFFDPQLPFLQVLPPGRSILEVKYDDFLPAHIRRLIQIRDRNWQAASKYVLCCMAARRTEENYAHG